MDGGSGEDLREGPCTEDRQLPERSQKPDTLPWDPSLVYFLLSQLERPSESRALHLVFLAKGICSKVRKALKLKETGKQIQGKGEAAPISKSPHSPDEKHPEANLYNRRR